MTSILSELPDGCGYYYGLAPPDHRQINVRFENRPMAQGLPCHGYAMGGSGWAAYVGGECVGGGLSNKASAEKVALEWMKENPLPHAREAS